MATVPTVAKRNDPTALEPYSKSRSTLAENLPAGWVGQWFRDDQLEEKCKPHEIGDQATGYLMVAGWQPCHKNEGIKTGPGPAAGSNNTDTVIRKGDLVLCKLPIGEYEKYAFIERSKDALVSKRIAGESHNFGGNTTFRSKVIGGPNALDASTSDILGAS
jgi:hypothetical protein